MRWVRGYSMRDNLAVRSPSPLYAAACSTLYVFVPLNIFCLQRVTAQHASSRALLFEFYLAEHIMHSWGNPMML